MLYCAHCRRNFARDHFELKLREKRRLLSGQRVLSARHAAPRGCGMETEYPESAELRSGKMTPAKSR